MVKLAERSILIQEFDGSRIVFDPVKLQTRLINCFLAAGLREKSYMAEDIALAVEYTLLNSPRPDCVFARGELETAVVRMLEETGFPDIAAIFRNSSSEILVNIDTTPEAITDLLHKFLACSPERFQKVVTNVCRAVEKLDIQCAPPHLILELARYYERLAESEQPPAQIINRSTPSTISQSELIKMLPQEAQELINEGVIRVNGISALFPCIRIFVMMKKFAEKFALTPPLTELELSPLLYQTGMVLEKTRAAIESRPDTPPNMPLYLAIPDMLEFIVKYFGTERKNSGKIGQELAQTLISEFTQEVYRLQIN